jgi:dipeptide/tripeptide permease
MVGMSTFNLLVQMAADDVFRGRVISIYYVALFAGLAIGSWLWGYLAALINVEACLIAAAVGLFLSTFLYRASSGSFSIEPTPATHDNGTA